MLGTEENNSIIAVGGPLEMDFQSIEIEGLDIVRLNDQASRNREARSALLEEPHGEHDDTESLGGCESSAGLLSDSYAADSIVMVKATRVTARQRQRRRLSNESEFAADSVDLVRGRNDVGLVSTTRAARRGSMGSLDSFCLEWKQVLKLGDQHSSGQNAGVKSLMMPSAVAAAPGIDGLQPMRISNSAA